MSSTGLIGSFSAAMHTGTRPPVEGKITWRFCRSLLCRNFRRRAILMFFFSTRRRTFQLCQAIEEFPEHRTSWPMDRLNRLCAPLLLHLMTFICGWCVESRMYACKVRDLAQLEERISKAYSEAGWGGGGDGVKRRANLRPKWLEAVEDGESLKWKLTASLYRIGTWWQVKQVKLQWLLCWW